MSLPENIRNMRFVRLDKWLPLDIFAAADHGAHMDRLSTGLWSADDMGFAQHLYDEEYVRALLPKFEGNFLTSDKRWGAHDDTLSSRDGIWRDGNAMNEDVWAIEYVWATEPRELKDMIQAFGRYACVREVARLELLHRLSWKLESTCHVFPSILSPRSSNSFSTYLTRRCSFNLDPVIALRCSNSQYRSRLAMSSLIGMVTPCSTCWSAWEKFVRRDGGA